MSGQAGSILYSHRCTCRQAVYAGDSVWGFAHCVMNFFFQAGDSSGMSLYVVSGSAEVDAVQLAELVSTVHELLPELGAGFITKCLK